MYNNKVCSLFFKAGHSPSQSKKICEGVLDENNLIIIKYINLKHLSRINQSDSDINLVTIKVVTP